MTIEEFRALKKGKPKEAPKSPKVERKHKVKLTLDQKRSELVAASVIHLLSVKKEVQHVQYDEGGGRILFSHEGVKYEVTVRPIP